MGAAANPPSGHVFRVERKRGPVWYAKYRLPDGRQVQKKLGPAWTGRGRPAAGYLRKRLAEDWLRETLSEARRGALPGAVRSGVTFADAAAEWLRYVSEDRDVKPSTLTDYRSVVASRLLPAFAALPIEELTPSLIALAGGTRCRSKAADHEPDPEQVGDDPRWDHGAGAQGLRAAVEPGPRSREAARALRRDPV